VEQAPVDGEDPAQPPLAADGMAAEGMEADAIEISGIRGYGHTGWFAEEQTLGQWFEVDLRLWLDLSPTGASDDLAQGLNYAEVVERVTQLLEGSRCRTIERLNTLILEALLTFPQVRRVHSRLVKVAAPIPGFDGRIAVAMTRAKPDGI
jgi:dihydroneopterin aldolase